MRCQETFFHIVVFPSVTVRDLTRFCVASHRWGQRHFDNSQIVIRVGEGGCAAVRATLGTRFGAEGSGEVMNAESIT